MTPEAAMRLALAQARRARGRSFPNPPVGAIVHRGGRVLGRGHTRPVGGAHAEVVAIEQALRRFGPRALRGAELSVTLEPCSHVGRTDPCVDLIAAVGIARVGVGHVDPHPLVAGRGVRRLRRAGVAVEVGVLEAECREQHRGFLCVVERGRPFVMLKLASTLDGRIATAAGESRWITGPEARAAVHRLRAAVDGILVGAGTAAADDPALTARSNGRVVHRPVRVVMDAGLRIAPSSRMLAGGDGRGWVLCSVRASAARRRALEASGARVLPVASARGRIRLRPALRRLAREGLTEVLVEGGGELAAELLSAGLVDEVHWFTSARLLGGDARPALGPLQVSRLAQTPRLDPVRVRRVGADVYVVGRPR